MTDSNNGFDSSKVCPDGHIKTIHTAVDSLKLNTLLTTQNGTPWKGNAKGIQLKYTDQHGPQVCQLHGGKFKGEGLKMASNKAIWESCNELLPSVKEFMMDEDDEVKAPKVTIVAIKKNGFWDVTDIKSGHVGVAGIVDPSAPAGSAGSTGHSTSSSYDGSAAAKGQIRNVALDLAKNANAKVKDPMQVLAAATEILEGDDFPTAYAAFMAASDKAYAALGGNKASAAKVKEKEPEPEQAEDEDLPDDDDDVPF